jgi:hypothetical protein
MGLIYIATAYSHPLSPVMTSRYWKVTEFAAAGINEGFVLYSPITHCHPMARKFKMPKDFQFWRDFNHRMIDNCTEMVVLQLPGWEDSKGVKDEMEYCEISGKDYLTFLPESDLGEVYSEACRVFWRKLKRARHEESGYL